MRLILSFYLIVIPFFSLSLISILTEHREVSIIDLAQFNYTESIHILKTDDSEDYFQIGLREGEELEILVVYKLKDGKKKKLNINSSLSESTIDNSSFFSGQKNYYFPISEFGEYEIQFSVKSKETIFIAKLYRQGIYDAITSTVQLNIPPNIQISTNKGQVFTGSKLVTDIDFPDSIKSMSILVHPIGTQAEDFFSNWFEDKINNLSNFNENEIPKELIGFKSQPKNDFAEEIFNYVKKKISYVDIENGINAIVPRDCGFVQTKGRGDCKDMANLLYSYYKFFGFEAYLAISKTNSMKEKFSFPSLAEANHMICILFLDGQPIFLDATERECMFRDPSLQIFNTEAFIIGKKPNFIEVSNIPFHKSASTVQLDFLVNETNKWASRLTIQTQGKANTVLKSLTDDNDFESYLPKIAKMLVSLDWKLVSNTFTDSSSYFELSALIPKSIIMNVGNSCYLDFANKIDLNMLSSLFYGDTIPSFSASTNFLITFPGSLKSKVETTETHFYKFSESTTQKNQLKVEFKSQLEPITLPDWKLINDHFNAFINKPIELIYEKP